MHYFKIFLLFVFLAHCSPIVAFRLRLSEQFTHPTRQHFFHTLAGDASNIAVSGAFKSDAKMDIYPIAGAGEPSWTHTWIQAQASVESSIVKINPASPQEKTRFLTCTETIFDMHFNTSVQLWELRGQGQGALVNEYDLPFHRWKVLGLSKGGHYALFREFNETSENAVWYDVLRAEVLMRIEDTSAFALSPSGTLALLYTRSSNSYHVLDLTIRQAVWTVFGFPGIGLPALSDRYLVVPLQERYQVFVRQERGFALRGEIEARKDHFLRFARISPDERTILVAFTRENLPFYSEGEWQTLATFDLTSPSLTRLWQYVLPATKEGELYNPHVAWSSTSHFFALGNTHRAAVHEGTNPSVQLFSTRGPEPLIGHLQTAGKVYSLELFEDPQHARVLSVLGVVSENGPEAYEPGSVLSVYHVLEVV